ncbi:MAG: hypothetical protein V4717_01195 [Bacteroidota bacterium]
MNYFRTVSLVLLAGILICFSSCRKNANDLISADQPPGLHGFTKYVIPQGGHFATENYSVKEDITEWGFQVYFDSSAIYDLAGNDQDDVNKLSGFADNDDSHTQFSARFGWRWSENKLRLFGFVHNSGVFSVKEITTIEIGKPYTCSIKVSANQYLFTVEDLKNTVTMEREATTQTAVGYRLYPYFGGNKVAPHEVRIWIKYL